MTNTEINSKLDYRYGRDEADTRTGVLTMRSLEGAIKGLTKWMEMEEEAAA